MKIYTFNPSNLFTAWSGQGGVDAHDAWTLVHAELDMTSVTQASMQTTKETSNFNSAAEAQFTLIAGDNDPITNEDPVLVPVAVKGDVAVFTDVNLNNAEEELLDYEYIQCASNKFIIWGVLNVSKTDFYTPASEGRGAIYISTDDLTPNF